jgi:DNA-binding GntR family transcriptional regulator
MASAKAQVKAYDFVKRQILEGVFAANTTIVPAEIGKRLGVSRMPVRTALLQLEKEGLITFGDNRRPVVTSLTVSEILELFEIRIALETLAIERAVLRLTADDFRALETLLGTMANAAERPKRWMELHSRFHDIIYSAAKMPQLLGEIRRIRQSIYPYLLLYNDLYTIVEMPGVEHGALLEILRRQDPALARTCLTEHIRNAASGVACFLLGKPAGQVGRDLLGGLLESKDIRTV